MGHKLPVTRVHLENAAILMQTEVMFAWPLLCDPSSRVIDWIKGYHENKQLVVVKYTVSGSKNIVKIPPTFKRIVKLL